MNGILTGNYNAILAWHFIEKHLIFYLKNINFCDWLDILLFIGDKEKDWAISVHNRENYSLICICDVAVIV